MKKQIMMIISMLAFVIFPFTGNAAANEKNGEIIALLIVANENEISSADKALVKSNTPSVKQYAHMLKMQHTDALKKTLTVKKKTQISPEDTQAVIALQQAGKKELNTLSALKNPAFEKAYINAMVKDHQKLLHLMDKKMLKNVSDPQVKALILEIRPHVVAHLEKAQMLQKDLQH